MFVRHVFRGTLEGHISPQRGPTEVITRIGVLLKILVNAFFVCGINAWITIAQASHCLLILKILRSYSAPKEESKTFNFGNF